MHMNMMSYMMFISHVHFSYPIPFPSSSTQDPYGDDLEDLSVINYVEGTLEICSTIMNSKQPSKRSSKTMTSP